MSGKRAGPRDRRSRRPAAILEIEGGSGEVATTGILGAPGDYVRRARVDHWDANDSTGGDQCCWTHGYVPTRVAPAKEDR